MQPTRLAQRDDMETVYGRTRVVKRLRSSQHGALKWAQRYGDSLVCVRYRHDARGQNRYTTVELVVDEAPVTRRARLNDTVRVRIAYSEEQLRHHARASGAQWERESRLWAMPRRIAKKLGLLSRIVQT